MKKIVMILMVFATVTVTAQRGKGREMQKLSAEEIATLQTKKMTLALVLNESQVNQVYQIQLAQAEKRKARREERKNAKENTEKSSKNRLERRNAQLDEKIALQNQMKTILTEDQFKQWRRMAKQRHQKRGQKERGRRSK